MKNSSSYAAIAAFCIAGLLAGCAPQEAKNAATAPVTMPTATTDAVKTVAVVTGQPKGSIKVGGRAICAVCAVKEGTKEPEEIKDTLDYKNKTYGFCNESEKAEFISEPTKYAQAD
ncbi:MAG: hypothetical protein H7145_12640 [Akkermansiaceae bacterium]|nr:hypothetical protein [Armatimonadota bacterium]